MLLFALPAFGITDQVTERLHQKFQFAPGGLKLWGLDIRPRATATLLYDDNVNISAGERLADVVGILAPGLAVGSGDYLFAVENFITLDYTPRFYFFLERSQYNSIEHNLNLSGQWSHKKLTFGVSQGLQISSGGEVEIGQRVTRKIYSTSAFLKYKLTGKSTLDISGSQTINDYEEFIGSREWANQNFLNYQIKPKLNLGAGVGFGYRDVETGPDQTYEQFLLRAAYELTGKINLSGTFGAEFQQYSGQGESGPSPIFSVAASYRPFDATSVTLEVSRRDQNSSILAGQNFTTTGLNASVRQRFFQRVFTTFGGGYENRQYRATALGVTADREDDYFFIRLNADWNPRPRWQVGVFFLHRENHSNEVPFDNNQVGLQTTFTF